MTETNGTDVKGSDGWERPQWVIAAGVGTAASGGSEKLLQNADQLLGRLAGVLGSMDDLPDYLDRVCAAVVDTVGACDAVGVTVILDNKPRTAAYTTVDTLEIDAMQYAMGDGPCLDAFRNRRENHVDLAAAAERWPIFVEAAEEATVRSVLAVPLVSGGQCFGALNLYGYRHHTFGPADATMARLAASRAADAVGSVVQLVGAHEVATQLERAMASRAVIEQAKGIIMGREGVDENTAFELLRRQSQDTNVKVRTVATALVRSSQDRPRGS